MNDETNEVTYEEVVRDCTDHVHKLDKRNLYPRTMAAGISFSVARLLFKEKQALEEDAATVKYVEERKKACPEIIIDWVLVNKKERYLPILADIEFYMFGLVNSLGIDRDKLYEESLAYCKKNPLDYDKTTFLYNTGVLLEFINSHCITDLIRDPTHSICFDYLTKFRWSLAAFYDRTYLEADEAVNLIPELTATMDVPYSHIKTKSEKSTLYEFVFYEPGVGNTWELLSVPNWMIVSDDEKNKVAKIKLMGRGLLDTKLQTIVDKCKSRPPKWD